MTFIVNVEKHVTDLLINLKLLLKPFIKALNQEALCLELYMVFVKSANSRLITVHPLDLLSQQSKHLHII